MTLPAPSITESKPSLRSATEPASTALVCMCCPAASVLVS
jgi:hypothetical protein